jgi:hypothetical protein
MNKFLTLILTFLLASCSTNTPVKELSADEMAVLISEINGKYKVIDSRSDSLKITDIDVKLTAQNGVLSIGSDRSQKDNYNLVKCRAFKAFYGKPVEAGVMCGIFPSPCQFSSLLVAKIKNDFVLTDGKLINKFEPMAITGGYVVSVKLCITSAFFNAAKE